MWDIPAGAGNTYHPAIAPIAPSVYPRWRGEHQHLLLMHCSLFGLSPLARGTLRYQYRHRMTPRFIPAGAGNTALIMMMIILLQVYPRWRGEHVI